MDGLGPALSSVPRPKSHYITCRRLPLRRRNTTIPRSSNPAGRLTAAPSTYGRSDTHSRSMMIP